MDKKELRERVDQLFQATKTDTSRHLKELKFLLKEAEKLEDIYIVGKLNMKLSLCWFDLGNRTAILAPAVKAVDIFEKLNDRNMLARSCNLLGLAYRALGNYQIAIENYNRAIDALRGLKRVAIRRDVMRNNIGKCYYLMGEYHKSVRILKECYAVLRQRAPFDHVNAAIYAINLHCNAGRDQTGY